MPILLPFGQWVVGGGTHWPMGSRMGVMAPTLWSAPPKRMLPSCAPKTLAACTTKRHMRPKHGHLGHLLGLVGGRGHHHHHHQLARGGGLDGHVWGACGVWLCMRLVFWVHLIGACAWGARPKSGSHKTHSITHWPMGATPNHPLANG